MQDPGLGYPEIGELPKACPWQARPLAAPPQGVPPMAQDLSAKRIESGPVAGNGVVVEIPLHHSMQPCALLGDRLMPLSQQRLLHRLQFGAEPLRHRLPPYVKPLGLARSSTEVGEAQEVEGFRLALVTLLSISGGEPSEFDQSRFVRVQRQAELVKTFLKFLQETFGLAAVLEPNDEIVGITHSNDIACGELRPPPLDPQVEDVVQVHVSQEG